MAKSGEKHECLVLMDSIYVTVRIDRTETADGFLAEVIARGSWLAKAGGASTEDMALCSSLALASVITGLAPALFCAGLLPGQAI